MSTEEQVSVQQGLTTLCQQMETNKMSVVQLPSLNITEILQAINSDVVEEQEKGCRAARYVLMGVNAALFLFRESYITNNFVIVITK